MKTAKTVKKTLFIFVSFCKRFSAKTSLSAFDVIFEEF